MISVRRDSWGVEYVENPKMREQGLSEGKGVPLWTDPGLALTFTDGHKIMAVELDAIKTSRIRGSTEHAYASQEAQERQLERGIAKDERSRGNEASVHRNGGDRCPSG